MSATGGFWPGESPAADEEQVQEPEAVEPRGWPQAPEQEAEPEASEPEASEPEASEPEPAAARVAEAAPVPEPKPEAEAEVLEEEEPEREVAPAGHLPGELDIPDGVAVLEGSPSGAERTVGVVVSRFNGEISERLLESALEALTAAGVAEERITVMPVPGAFELPIGAMALAKTRRYSCVIALGCVVRGETAHFDYVAGEAASGLQLAGLETGVPVAFGVLTVDTAEQAEARVDKGADAARAALEMADLFSQVRRQAKSG
ncbi:MAG TPA: 6,7-dimethyl-8-ribityllumazine synthase [Gaiellaceae bacterium]|jgi:6,7-dimethyl-8-ribityllumazine synthase|nr:6,7-dimethyl-8-ribityllumazine synthase [Gaiellaceae bacterium]